MSCAGAITGVGCVSAYGLGVAEFCNGVSRNEPAPAMQRRRLDGSSGVYRAAPAAETLSGYTASPVTRLARATLLARTAAEEAWRSSGVAASVAPERAGLIVNRNFAPHQVIGQYYETLWQKGPGGVSGLQFVQTIANNALGSLAMHYQLRGPCEMHFGPPALGAALDALRDDAADAILAGGFDELSDYIFELCHASALVGAAGSEAACARPYHAASRGLIPGEGAAFFVLENLSHAEARRATPLGYLKGYGAVTDASAARNPAERRAEDVAEAIRRALCDAAVEASDVGFVSGGANGVSTMDCAEIEAVARIFPHGPALFSIKRDVGETWGAAAGLSMIAALRALAGVVPHAATASASDKALAPRRNTALVLSMDMSGQNAAFVIGDVP